MKVYLQIIEKNIIAVDSEKNEYCTVELEANSIDEFYSLIEEKSFVYEEEIEEELKKVFEEDEKTNSLETYQIKHWVSNRSFGELIDMYDNDEIIKPDMQREFVWSSQKCSRLIESIILGLPIPPLFLLETGSNEYEIIDGFQRITTLSNYVNGKTWTGEKATKRNVAKLTGNVADEIKGKSFFDLKPEYQRKIKRSTIPLIEFKQMGEDDTSSKYLIFERINTGSEKLNDMQIRKSLAYGKLIKSVYEKARSCKILRMVFSAQSLKKDVDVESLLRVYAMSEIFYKDLPCDKRGINVILNDFCEKNRGNEITNDFMDRFESAWELMLLVFVESRNMFRRVTKSDSGEYSFAGNMNMSIFEAMLGVSTFHGLNKNNSHPDEIRERYFNLMHEQNVIALSGKAENPFSTSTGTLQSVQRRFKICEEILGVH